jgi:NAD(P)H-hydrate repair Nnr-like enzyme with NAD(P)H-hydrate epimerase domain
LHWLACGPGNNGGDGLEAAVHLQQWGRQPVVTWLGTPDGAPADAHAAWQRAVAAGVHFADHPPHDLGPADLCVDALLGLGSSRAPSGTLAAWVARMNSAGAPVLAVDLPTGLHADTGQPLLPLSAQTIKLVANNDHPMRTQGQFDSNLPCTVRAQHTLSLLTLKPGLFTTQGRDLAGQVWFDDFSEIMALRRARVACHPHAWPHASHKGMRGDVAVLGGAAGMQGAALLAGSAALHGGAGRVWVALLDGAAPALDPQQPELMLRAPGDLDWGQLTVVCGCGGGAAVAPLLPRVLAGVRLVLTPMP